jgi:hypothetical protein
MWGSWSDYSLRGADRATVVASVSGLTAIVDAIAAILCDFCTSEGEGKENMKKQLNGMRREHPNQLTVRKNTGYVYMLSSKSKW